MPDLPPEPLRYTPGNASTGVVERVRDRAGTSLVHKQLRRAGTVPTAPAHWAASEEAWHWNYWHREAEVYSDVGLRRTLSAAGLDLAAATVEERGATTSLWLEDVAGTAGPGFDVADHVATAAALGRWQGRPAGPSPAWASRGFLRDYSTSRPVDLALVADDAAWEQPLVRDTWPGTLRAGWDRLLHHREHLLAVMVGLPRTLCHLDAWVSNVIRRPDGRVVLLDWAFAGDGAVGEDLGNYLPDAVLDLFWPAARLAELEAACLPAYLAGLREAGWSGTDREARLGVVASCVKYAWLLPLMLARAGEQRHDAYHRPVGSEQLYTERGAVLAHLVGWCDEALELAPP